MKTMFDPKVLEATLARIHSITADTAPVWGKMNAQQMLAHLVESARMGSGETNPKRMWTPFRYPLLRQLLVYVLPFPKGAPTLRELRAPSDPASIEQSQQELTRLLTDFASRRDQKQWPEHAAFGAIGRRGWGVLTFRHFDHHLRQFGA